MAGEMGTTKAIIIAAVLIGGVILAGDLVGSRYAFSANPGVDGAADQIGIHHLRPHRHREILVTHSLSVSKARVTS